MLSLKKLNFIDTSLILLAIASLLGILANSYVTFYWSDDFHFVNALRSMNAFEFIWHQFLNWDGRHLTLQGLMQASLFELGNAFYSTLVWAICYILAFYLMAKVFFNANKLLITALVSCSFLIIFQSHLFQTLYWATGGVYSMVLMIGCLWLWYYNLPKRSVALLVIISFLAGSTSQNFSVSLITIVFLDIIFRRIKSEKIEPTQIIALSFLIAGTIFITVAPGNASRANLMESDWNIYAMYNQMTGIYHDAFMLTKPIFVIAPVVAFISYNFLKTNSGKLYESIKYFFAAIASLSPFIILPSNLSVEARILIFFHFFIFCSMLNLSWFAIYKLKNKPLISKLLNLNYVRTFYCLSILIPANALLLLNFNNGLIMKEAFVERERHILTLGQEDYLVEPIQFYKGRAHFMHYFFDITTDSTHAFNRIKAAYYKINSIRVTEQRAFLDRN